MRARTGAARLLLASSLAGLALLAAGAASAAAAPAAAPKATSRCWLQVVNDWLDNNRVDGTYAKACYTQAIQHLNAYPDIQQYSSAMDDIHRALLAVIHDDRGSGPGGGTTTANTTTNTTTTTTTTTTTNASSSPPPPPSSGGPGGSSGGGAPPSSGGGNDGGSGGHGGNASAAGAPTPVPSTSDHQSFITRLFHAVGPGDAQSIPLPLLVLAGLAGLLLLAAAATWLARRLQSRRISPAPATVPAHDKRR